ncbi:uncharacterized protein MYCFIDRAFT_185716 [Pseudocercospora fijiensis CIRAD86]|uniref:Uncharacterized protein n=1 Tax=Pseudocercospora fijiensis (strain CIRAD86) TaxID=383855 RepID=N1QBD9_PSEFD|nr:uncharacterized protein MYCFIDRAFT_185716 [Pseudocercospora fijiensis CIRAD86]EME89401.1 hypothetical protein MYCFIDRAFT_185716 [Pseudocercospora fijiensis CIRAD86]
MPRQVAPPPSGEFRSHSVSSEKSGDVPKDDVNELMSLVSALRGFPSHPSKDVYGLDATLDLTTFDIQDEFKRIVDSIEALGRTFAR